MREIHDDFKKMSEQKRKVRDKISSLPQNPKREYKDGNVYWFSDDWLPIYKKHRKS